MTFTILGSGGCVALPMPTCQCPICRQAREKGAPYARRGCSLYLHEAALVVDTPEDIVASLNAADIPAVEAIAYSHWDPDHTLGMRVLEQLRMDWLALSVNAFQPHPIRVLALDGVMADLNGLRSPYGPLLDYYEGRGLARREIVSDTVALGDIRMTLVPVDATRRVTVFVFEQAGKRLLYAPCDVKPFPDSPLFAGADILILGSTMVGPSLKDGFSPAADNPLHRELYTLEEALSLKARYGIRRLIITHLEEDWGKSYDDYLAIASQHDSLQFAYDGMRVTL